MKTSETTRQTSRRKPIEAAALSAMLPGLGFLYLGLFCKGMLWIGASVALMVVAISALLASPSSGGGLLLASLCIAAGIGLSILSVVLSWRLARTRHDGFELREYNRWYVYLIFILLGTIGSSIGFAYVLRARAVQAFVIPTRSMSPTINPGDRILALKEVFLDRDPERGELVVFRNPAERRQFWIKRVVALGGDRIEWRADGEILLNGESLPHTPGGGEDEFRERIGTREYSISLASAPDGALPAAEGSLTVPQNHCFVLGDNRPESKDSRHFGVIAYTNLLAKPVAKVWGGFGMLE